MPTYSIEKRKTSRVKKASKKASRKTSKKASRKTSKKNNIKNGGWGSSPKVSATLAKAKQTATNLKNSAVTTGKTLQLLAYPEIKCDTKKKLNDSKKKEQLAIDDLNMKINNLNVQMDTLRTQLAKAETEYNKVYITLDENGNNKEISTVFDANAVYLKCLQDVAQEKNLKDALNAYSKSLATAQKMGDQSGITTATNNIERTQQALENLTHTKGVVGKEPPPIEEQAIPKV